MRGGNTAKIAPIDVSKPEIRGPIDLDFLARQTLGDEGLEQEVLRLFDQMSHAYFERLETSTSVSDLLRNLHTLRGAAAGVGAFALAELARWNGYLARGLVPLVFTLAPELFVLGTIAAAAGEALCLAPVRDEVRRRVWPFLAPHVRIEASALGEELPYHAGLGVAVGVAEEARR
jgi:predicted NBD/HSP70 family sugar kinase